MPAARSTAEVLRDVRLGRPDRLGQAADLDRTAGEHMQDLEPSRTGERLEDLGLEDRDLVHALTIDICAGADECRPARAWGPKVIRSVQTTLGVRAGARPVGRTPTTNR